MRRHKKEETYEGKVMEGKTCTQTEEKEERGRHRNRVRKKKVTSENYLSVGKYRKMVAKNN